MLNTLLARVFGSRNQRMLRRIGTVVSAVNALEPKIKAMSDAELAAQTQKFRARLAAGESLDALMPEAFATVRETGRRVLGMRHFDVQLIGGAVLHQGRISEMRTGEGKTLVSTLPAYLNALTGKGVHIVTVNDYLARRDAEWMGRIHRFLGLSVGVVVPNQSPMEKREAYAADVTYATNNELGFDYLRDNLAFSLADKMQRGHAYAIVDEVDSILIDEARTPLIISGPTDDDPALWQQLNALVPRLTRQADEEAPGHFFVDEKAKQIHLSEAGHEQMEDLLRGAGLLGEDESLYDPARIVLVHHVNALLRAHHLYKRDVEYISRGGQIVIIDEFTGRMMSGRRWSDGLHQAIEAKEGVPIQQENQTLASITFQNYFRLYGKLSGMTGTADTEAFEFQNIYNLEVVIVPTNKPMIRDDRGDLVFGSAEQKFNAVIKDIQEVHGRGQPILVGTASIETSELLSGLLKQKGIKHEVLNAKQHEREADIVAQAGRLGAVTIATNMAGRGTDIVLGGNLENELAKLPADDAPGSEGLREQVRSEWRQRHEQVLASGGLYVIGSERHESRRIDNQLRGRSGRQGDPGATRFYLSLDDTLMRIFTPPRMRKFLMSMGLQDGEPLEHRMVSNAIETAQRKVEAQNFDQRKNLLEYDNVANDQRKAVYELRDELMTAENVTPLIDDIRSDVMQAVMDTYIVPQSAEDQWNLEGLEETLLRDFDLRAPVRQWLKDDPKLEEHELRARILKALVDSYAAKRQREPAALAHAEKVITLQILDQYWREHLAAIDYLRQGIHLRGYAQKDPKQEYKREAFTMFNDMLARFKHAVTSNLSRVQMLSEDEVAAMEEARRQPVEMQAQHAEAQSVLATEEPAIEAAVPAPAAPGRLLPPAPHAAAVARPETFVREVAKVGRNDPCPCGSGKKYKQCHGRLS